MAQVKVFSDGAVQTSDVDASLFGERVLGRTLKDAVVMYEANKRQGTVKTKTRSEVKGPNKKLWKQKHTGRARMGTPKSPLWRGGGRIFGPRPRDYSYHMPKKARRTALYNAVFAKLQDGEIAVASGWPSDKPNTKAAISVLQTLGMEKSVMVVTQGIDDVLFRSLRNVKHVEICPVSDLNARNVLLRQHVVFTPEAMATLQANAKAHADSRKRVAGSTAKES